MGILTGFSPKKPFDKVILNKLLNVEDVNELDEVMRFIETRLKAIPTDKLKKSTSAAYTTPSVKVKSCIKYGYNMLGKVLSRAKIVSSKILCRETRKALIDILKETAQIHWLVAGLSAVAYVLSQMEKVSTNRDECIQLLKKMCELAKQIKKLHNPSDHEKLIDVVTFIVTGSFFCISQMQSNKLSSFLFASSKEEELKSLKEQLSQIYLDLALDGIIRLLNLSARLPPTMGKDKDPKAVGIDEARDDVVKLLDLKDQSIRSVVLYGLGGVGKTTLATAVVFSPDLDLSAYKCCRINIQDDYSESHVKERQQQILRELFNENVWLNDSLQGAEHLFKLFKEATSQPLFLFIDNVLRGTDMAKFLPEDLSCLPKRSRILITTKNLNETGMSAQGGVTHLTYIVKPLSNEASILLLRRKALGSAHNPFDPNMNIDDLVQICSCIPQLLESAGTDLHKLGNDASACQSTIDNLKAIFQTDSSDVCNRVVDGVYNSLKEEFYKDAFLDVAAFFNDWDERMVGYIVGQVALQAIKGTALVMVNEEGKVIVNSIALQRGRKFSEENRISDHKSLLRALGDMQRLAKLKGIRLPPPAGSDEFQLRAEHLKGMSKSLRILHLGERNRLHGEIEETFTNLRLLHINGDLTMELTNLGELTVLQAYLKKRDGLSDSSRLLNIPSSVYDLHLPDCISPSITDIFSKESRIGGPLSHSFCQLKSLRLLEIVDCLELTNLPENIRDLSSLEILNLSGSRHLVELPMSFSALSRLRDLNISNCERLSRLPDGFCKLQNLRNLDISGCSNLGKYLPENIGDLSSLEILNLSGNRHLVELPESFTSLSCLRDLNISNCERLSKLPDEFWKLQNLENLDISGCSNLGKLSEAQLPSRCKVNA